MSAENRQVGGDHYQKLGIQPMKFAMVNDWDAGAFSILNYLSRHRRKDGKKDIEKAIHFVELRADHVSLINRPTTPILERISMREYVKANEFDKCTHFYGIRGSTGHALFCLEFWVYDEDEKDLKNLMDWLTIILRAYS